MTDTYLRRPVTVRAFKFAGQPQADWPAWLREHKIVTNLGVVTPAMGNGVMLIPTASGPTVNVTPGQVVVLERNALTRYKPEEFDEFFQALEAEAAPAAPEPPAETFVAAEAAPESKPVAAKKPAKEVEETPAAPAEAETPAEDA